MKIHIENLKFETIIGILDSEREAPQEVVIDLTATYAFNNEKFIDYAIMVGLIKKDLLQQKYGLIEHALIGLKKKLLEHYPEIKKLSIKIAKPNIMPSCKVALSQTWKLK